MTAARPWPVMARELGWAFRHVLIALVLLFLTACASARDTAIVSLNSTSAFGATAEKVIADLDVQGQRKCLAFDTPLVRDECILKHRLRFHAAYETFRTFRATWMALAAAVRLAEQAEGAYQKPDEAELVRLGLRLADAARAFAIALDQIRGDQ